MTGFLHNVEQYNVYTGIAEFHETSTFHQNIAINWNHLSFMDVS